MTDAAQIDQFLRFVYGLDEVFEVRGLGWDQGILRALHRGTYARAAKHAVVMNTEYGANCYYTLHTIAEGSGLLRDCADGMGRLQIGAERTTSSGDIASYRFLFIDVDTDREDPESAAADDQLAIAQQAAEAVRNYLSGVGWPEPLAVLSGNGFHHLYKLTGENIETAAIAGALRFLQLQIADIDGAPH